MNTYADKSQEKKSQSVTNAVSQKRSGGESTFQFVDNRPEAIAQRKLQEMANNSPRAMQLKAFQDMTNNSPQAKQAAQLQAMADNHSAQQQQPIQKKESTAGLPRIGKSALFHSNDTKTVQLVRIKLRNEDAVLMEQLRMVPVNQEGTGTVEAPTGLSDLDGLIEIGASENIILEGHGTKNDKGETHGQGRWSPNALAKFAHKVPKPEEWTGSIILLGCSTADIVEAVSKEYYKLTKKSVTVTGTKQNIRVAKDSQGTNFVGSDWSLYPENERPPDLDIVKKVEEGLEAFNNDILVKFIAVVRAMKDTTDDTSVVIPHDLSNLGLDTFKIIPPKAIDSKYQFGARYRIYSEFNKILEIITDNVDIVIGRILRAKSKDMGLKQISGETYESLMQFMPKWEKDYIILLQQIRGLQLKRIDLLNPEHVTRSRMAETSAFGGLLGYTWQEQIGQ